MNRKKIALTGATAAALVLAAGGVAIAGSGDDDASDIPIPGPALQKASDAALAETGGGEVTETEVDDEESYYEVEVTLDKRRPGRRAARQELQRRRLRERLAVGDRRLSLSAATGSSCPIAKFGDRTRRTARWSPITLLIIRKSGYLLADAS